MPKLRPVIRLINAEAQHHQVLFELGLLDDSEDWPLFQKQEARYAPSPEEDEHWLKYLAGTN